MLTSTAPDVLVAQVELDLLVGALDDEGRVGVHDGPQPLEGEAAGHADHELLADADVEHALGARGSSETPISARTIAVRGSSSSARVASVVEALAHGGHRSTSAHDHVRPLAPVAVSARSSASWSRPSTRGRAPALELEARRDPARPVVGRGVVVDHDRGEAAEPEPAGELHRLPVAALVELGVADQADTRAPGARAPQAERRAHRDGQAVPERAARDLHARDEQAIGVIAQRRVEAAEAGQAVDVDEALGGQDRVVGGRAVALGEQEAVALGIVGGARVQAQDAVVEDPQHVERRERAAVVLLVARELGQQGRQVVVVEGRGGSHCRTVRPQLWFKSRAGPRT